MAAIAPRVPPRVAWMNARTERDAAAVERLAADLLEKRPQDDLLRRNTARLLEAQGRAAEAAPHWAALRDADADDFEAAYHVAVIAVAGGAAPDSAAAAAAPTASALFRAQLADALADRAPSLAGPFTHVAICGVSYCGSTLIDRVLGGLPGVKSIGESHWLVKERAGSDYRNASMSRPLEDAPFVPCTVCGHNCAVLSRGFRRSLAADHGDWYRKIAARLGTKMLVSADKNAPKLVENDPLLDLSALVVFKSPEQAWRSKLNKLPLDRDAAWYEAECRTYVGVWTRSYRTYLDHFRPQGPVAYLSFDAFTDNPVPLLRAACDALALPFDARVLSRTEPGHAIGGNSGSMARLRAKDYAIVIEALPDPALDPLHAAIIAEDTAMQATWHEMLALHERLLDRAAA